MTSAIERLRAGERVDDADFDALYPAEVREVSSVHWTRVEVARRAAHLLTDAESAGHVADPRPTRVLDVGSGVGKFCLVGALVTDASFTGVEHRRSFHETARALAVRHRVERVSFVRADFAALDFRAFDAVYLFNPFYEHLDPSVRLDVEEDDATRGDRGAHTREVFRVLEKLRELPVGARVVTHHGFGAALPSPFRRTHLEPTLRLERWVRA